MSMLRCLHIVVNSSSSGSFLGSAWARLLSVVRRYLRVHVRSFSCISSYTLNSTLVSGLSKNVKRGISVGKGVFLPLLES